MSAYRLTESYDFRGTTYEKGLTLYLYRGHDYGCARDDGMAFGEPFQAMTLDRAGAGVFFTVPLSKLEPLNVPA
jgi:hypothetical protein